MPTWSFLLREQTLSVEGQTRGESVNECVCVILSVKEGAGSMKDRVTCKACKATAEIKGD